MNSKMWDLWEENELYEEYIEDCKVEGVQAYDFKEWKEWSKK